MIPPHKRAEVGMSYLPQEPSIFRNLSVKSNILALQKKFLKKKILLIFIKIQLKSLVLSLLRIQWVMCYQAGKEEKLK